MGEERDFLALVVNVVVNNVNGMATFVLSVPFSCSSLDESLDFRGRGDTSGEGKLDELNS